MKDAISRRHLHGATRWRRLTHVLAQSSRELILLAAIFLAGAYFSTLSDHFLQADNLTTILRNSVDLAIIGAGMTLVIIMGGIDVSVGGILAVSAIFIGRAFQSDLPIVLIVLTGPVVGTCLGLINGLICTRGQVPPIIATLGTMYVWLAVLFLIIGGRWIAGLPSTLAPLIRGEVLGIPSVVIIIGLVYGFCWFVLRLQPLGRHLYAIGNNELAARLSGVNVDRVKVATYAFLGCLAGFAALLYVARLRNVEINIGTTIALDAIAATILGGTNIKGGEGSLIGTLLGVLFIQMIQNGLVLTGVSSLWETVIVGTLLLLVLVLDTAHRQGLWKKR